jgi:hypothetical protein
VRTDGEDALELAERLRVELDELQRYLVLEEWGVLGEEHESRLLTARAHLQYAQGILEDLAALLADDEGGAT